MFLHTQRLQANLTSLEVTYMILYLVRHFDIISYFGCIVYCSQCKYYADLSKAIYSSIKDKINDLTDNDDYEFGDLR